jgi:hypothetical protein
VLFAVRVGAPDGVDIDEGLEGVLDTGSDDEGECLLYARASGRVSLGDSGSVRALGSSKRATTVDKLEITEKKRKPVKEAPVPASSRAALLSDLKIGPRLKAPASPVSTHRLGGGAGIAKERWPTREGKPLSFLFQLPTSQLPAPYAGVAVFVANSEGYLVRRGKWQITAPFIATAIAVTAKELTTKPVTRSDVETLREVKLTASPRKSKAAVTHEQSVVGEGTVVAPKGYRAVGQVVIGLHDVLKLLDSEIWAEGQYGVFVKDDGSAIQITKRSTQFEPDDPTNELSSWDSPIARG